MKKAFLVFTALILVIISLGYLKNVYSIFVLVNASDQNVLYASSNWVVESINPAISSSFPVQEGDSIVGVGNVHENNFITLDNALVDNKGKNVEIEVIRQGKLKVLNVTVPADFEINQVERRLIMKPTYKGDPAQLAVTPYVRSRLMVGELILVAMALFCLIVLVLILMKKRIGWYLGTIVLLTGLFGVIRAGGMGPQFFGRVLLFIALGVGLLLSYQKKPQIS